MESCRALRLLLEAWALRRGTCTRCSCQRQMIQSYAGKFSSWKKIFPSPASLPGSIFEPPTISSMLSCLCFRFKQTPSWLMLTLGSASTHELRTYPLTSCTHFLELANPTKYLDSWVAQHE